MKKYVVRLFESQATCFINRNKLFHNVDITDEEVVETLQKFKIAERFGDVAFCYSNDSSSGKLKSPSNEKLLYCLMYVVNIQRENKPDFFKHRPIVDEYVLSSGILPIAYDCLLIFD